MLNKVLKKIFQSGSRTYFYSSLFFPPHVRQEVAILYAFVRVADDYVDSVPQDQAAFEAFRLAWEKAWRGQAANNQIIDGFVALAREKNFSYSWIDDFLNAMAADTKKSKYESLQETEEYMYGSAEVVGLMMAKIMNLPEESWRGARLLGRAMQYINFIRDLAEDERLGRQYLPTAELTAFGLASLSRRQAEAEPEKFSAFIHKQLDRYEKWQKQAEEYFHFIPTRYLIPIATAAAMYDYTARRIRRRPLKVFRQKIKPSVFIIILSGFIITFKIIWNRYLAPTKKK